MDTKNNPRDPYSSYEAYLENQQKFQITKENQEKNRLAEKKKKKLTFFLWIFFLVFLFSLITGGAYFILKIGSTGKKISLENSNHSVIKNTENFISSFMPSRSITLRGEEEGRINILLLGTAGKGKPGQNLTDTIMVMSIDTKNKKIAMLSLPRDFYAPIPETSYSTKINSIYQYGINNQEGVDPMKKTIEEITGIPVHYFIILDFDGFKKIIDDIGGINVSVERNISDARYPGPNYSYETFEISKGNHLLNGETALKYVRERHDDPEGDFGRAKRQQQVMQSAKNKIFSIGTFLNPIVLNNVLNDLGDNIKTDIGMNEIEGFVDLARKSDTQNINNAVVDAWEKDSILKVSHIFAGGANAFILVPRIGNYSEIQDLAANIFDLDAIRRRKAEIEKENASVTVINQSGYKNMDSKVKEILENKLGIGDVKIGYSPNSSIAADTLIFDNSSGNKIFTLDEIVKKLGAKLSPGESDIIKKQNSDLVLMLGSDLENIDSAEDSPDDLKNAPDSQNYFDLIKK